MVALCLIYDLAICDGVSAGGGGVLHTAMFRRPSHLCLAVAVRASCRECVCDGGVCALDSHCPMLLGHTNTTPSCTNTIQLAHTCTKPYAQGDDTAPCNWAPQE